jgi:hypothetical protein
MVYVLLLNSHSAKKANLSQFSRATSWPGCDDLQGSVPIVKSRSGKLGAAVAPNQVSI